MSHCLQLFILLHTIIVCSIHSLFVAPITWTEIPIPNEQSSMSTIIDANDNIYLCGGKISLFDKSKKCIRIEIENNPDSNAFQIEINYSGGNGLKSSGPFPGLYFNAKPFTSESQNEGGLYGDRMCLLSISDGTNKPKCWCCDMTELNLFDTTYSAQKEPSDIKCDDLQYSITGGCPARFDACVIYDDSRNIMYQMGGYYGQSIYDTILCFDMESETYLSDPFSCKYGTLNKPMYAIGCAMVNHVIVTVGGMDTLSTSANTQYMDTITVCEDSHSDCHVLPNIRLSNGGVLKTRVFGILSDNECLIGIVGGIIISPVYQSQIPSDTVYVVNICTQQLVYTDVLPAPVSHHSIIQTHDGILCLYGGISFDYETNAPKVSDSAYCTVLSAPSTVTPTTVIPTTSMPTAAPTAVPTLSNDIASIANLSDPSFSAHFISFDEGVSGQICYSHNQYLFVCGGQTTDTNAATNNKCLVYDRSGSAVFEFPIHIEGSLISNLYCQNQCYAQYNNALFLVNPIINNEQQTHALYKCVVDDEVGIIDCTDLCTELEWCTTLLPIHSCITSHREYLYISGGYDLTNHRLLDGISVFNMGTLMFVSVPFGSIPSLMYSFDTYFDALPTPIASHSCSFINSTLYVIGGYDIVNDVSISEIQRCAINDDCHTSQDTQLTEARYNARSTVIGDSIITVCGTRSIHTFSDSIEIYDALVGKQRMSVMSDNIGRSECCLVSYDRKVMIAGGKKWVRYKSEPVNTVIYSPYALQPIMADPDSESESEITLLDCKNINVDTRDFSFKSLYKRWRQIGDSYLFTTMDHKAYLIIDTTANAKTWIYNYTEKTSCFFNSDKTVELGPGIWTKPRTRRSQTHSILITLSCYDMSDSLQGLSEHSHDNRTILSQISDAVLITIIVVIALIVITVLVVGLLCWLKRTKHYSHYRYTYKPNKIIGSDQDRQEIVEEEYSTTNENGRKTITIVRYDIDHRDNIESSCTVNPNEVLFDTIADKNTQMFDTIALEALQTTKKQIELQPPPPPPPVHATMFGENK